MKKTISVVLVGGQLLFFGRGYTQDFDLDQFQRKAEEAIRREKDYSVPAAITSHYAQSLKIKYDTVNQIINRYNKAVQNLTEDTQHFNNKLISFNISSIKTLDDYKKFLEHVNDLDKRKDNIRDSLYNYRKSESDLLELKDSMKNYCEETSNYERYKSLILNPSEFQLQDYNFDAELKNHNETLGKDPDVTGTFLGTLGIFAISGLVVALIANGGSLAGLWAAIVVSASKGGVAAGATGWGALAVVVAVIVAFAVSSIVHDYKMKKERERIERLKREIKKRYEESVEWYKKNTIINKQNMLQKMTYELCTAKNFKVNVEANPQKEQKVISIYETRQGLETKIDSFLSQIKDTNNNIIYNKEESKKLQHLYSLASGNVFDPDLRSYKDSVSKNLVKAEDELAKLKKEIDVKREELAKIFSAKEVEQVQASFASSRKFVEATHILYQKIGTEKVHELFSNHLNHSKYCHLYIVNQEQILDEIKVLKDSIYEKYVDNLNKDDSFFTKKIPEVINLIHKITTVRTNRVCKDYVE
jgi:hypothetical protein